jgi:hypothetical protein
VFAEPGERWQNPDLVRDIDSSEESLQHSPDRLILVQVLNQSLPLKRFSSELKRLPIPSAPINATGMVSNLTVQWLANAL